MVGDAVRTLLSPIGDGQEIQAVEVVGKAVHCPRSGTVRRFRRLRWVVNKAVRRPRTGMVKRFGRLRWLVKQYAVPDRGRSRDLGG